MDFLDNFNNGIGTISNELYQSTNLALLCEDIVNGMIAANEFRGTDDTSFPMSLGHASQNSQLQHRALRRQLEVVVDIQSRDWEYRIQPGELSPALDFAILTLSRCSQTCRHEHLWQRSEIHKVRLHHGAVES